MTGEHTRSAPRNHNPACPIGSKGQGAELDCQHNQHRKGQHSPPQKHPPQKEVKDTSQPLRGYMHRFERFLPPKAPGIERFVSSASARMGIHAGHASLRPGKTDPRLAPQLLPWSLYIPLSHFFITPSRLIACDYFSLITANGLHRFVTITDNGLQRFEAITANGLRHV